MRLPTTVRQPVRCILPPHVISGIAERGTARQRARALRSLALDNTFRALRTAMRPTAPRPGRRAGVTAEEGQKQRTISDTHNTQNLPGDVVRVKGTSPTGDPAVDEAYDGLGATYDLDWDVYDRNSIDDEGLALDATVHFGQDYDN